MALKAPNLRGSGNAKCWHTMFPRCPTVAFAFDENQNRAGVVIEPKSDELQAIRKKRSTASPLETFLSGLKSHPYARFGQNLLIKTKIGDQHAITAVPQAFLAVGLGDECESVRLTASL